MNIDAANYTWEDEYEHSWLSINLSENGSLYRISDKLKDPKNAEKKSNKCENETKNTLGRRLGIVRDVVFIIDFSAALIQSDLRPSRPVLIESALLNYVDKFTSENPLSRIAIVGTANRKAYLISSFNFSAKYLKLAINFAFSGIIKSNHDPNNLLGENSLKYFDLFKKDKMYKELTELVTVAGKGEPSLQNALECAYHEIPHVNKYSTLEFVVIWSAMNTCDPADINMTIKKLKVCSIGSNNKKLEKLSKNVPIKVNAIGFFSKIHIIDVLTRVCQGTYKVVSSPTEISKCLNQLLKPTVLSKYVDNSLIKVAFPLKQLYSTHEYSTSKKMKIENDIVNLYQPTEIDLISNPKNNKRTHQSNELVVNVCECHIGFNKYDKSKHFLNSDGYLCPQCKTRFCSLPVYCTSCDLLLLSPSQIIQSSHFTTPPIYIKPIDVKIDSTIDEDAVYVCLGCNLQESLDVGSAEWYNCEKCKKYMCGDCKELIVNSLSFCPECN
ncbi:General transcription factor IIH subunit 2 [Intoshia linei]|uniref:General transcription factor IIH subunit 2 n=1 Tax=Intoshia linei TaxID=1819745 RepID=A0A177B4A0_9BILA|nr:General transcription factor IIH subunit 2 [Intoshia linei]